MNWYKSNAPTSLWRSTASDSTGNKLVAVVEGGYIYTSNDAGVIWNGPYAFSAEWTHVASNSNGSRLYATRDDTNSRIWSSINGGSIWNVLANCPQSRWRRVSTDSNGQYLVASNIEVTFTGYIYTSSNYGTSWTQRTAAGNRNWSGLAVNSSGSIMYACVFGGAIWRSTNSGASWSVINNANINWIDIATDSTGTKVVAVVKGGGIYTSINSGVTWSNSNDAPIANWECVASDSTGTNLIAGSNGSIYISNNSGVNWIQQTSSPTNVIWISVTTNSDGTEYSAAVLDGGIYTTMSTQPAAPTNYYTIQTGQSTDLSDVFAPLTSTSAATTNFLVENYNNTGVTKDLNQIFEGYVSGSQAQTTNFIIENYNGTGIKDLNQIFKPL